MTDFPIRNWLKQLNSGRLLAGQDVYYGGTSYANKQGLGVQLPLLPAGRN